MVAREEERGTGKNRARDGDCDGTGAGWFGLGRAANAWPSTAGISRRADDDCAAEALEKLSSRSDSKRDAALDVVYSAPPASWDVVDDLLRFRLCITAARGSKRQRRASVDYDLR